MNKIKEWLKSIAIGCLVGVSFTMIVSFVNPYTVVQVNGSSMYPTYRDGQMLLVNTGNTSYDRGDIVVADTSLPDQNLLLKRIIGIPGDTLVIYKDGRFFLNGELQRESYLNDDGIMYGWDINPKTYPDDIGISDKMEITLSCGEYFLMGDNRNHSLDSRKLGIFTEDKIRGVIIEK